MRNKIFGKKLARNRKSREALFVSLVQNVIEHGEITTTLTKAKAIQVELDKLMQDVAKGDVAGKRHAAAFLRNNRESVDKLFELKDLAKSRVSGFSSIMRLPSRRGDNAEMAKLSWVAVASTAPKAEEAKEEK
jgi:large subunit ribosomal protein L17